MNKKSHADEVWERYKKKQEENNKLIEEMNYMLHVGHIRHNAMCSNCFRTLGRKKIGELLNEKEEYCSMEFEKLNSLYKKIKEKFFDLGDIYLPLLITKDSALEIITDLKKLIKEYEKIKNE